MKEDEEIEPIKFELSLDQTKKYLEWQKSLPELPQTHWGVNGGGYIFTIIPTSIGDIIKVKREDGDPSHEIDLSDYDTW